MPYYEDQYPADYGWLDDEYPEPEEPEENVICECDNCGEDIYDCDEMVVVEEHIVSGRPGIKHICMGCWEANDWEKSKELLDLIGIWYWSGDAVEAMKIGNGHYLEA